MKVMSKQKMVSMGIDPSVTCTGLVVLRENKEGNPELLLEEEIKGGKLKGMERVQFIVTRVMERIHEIKPDKIVIEGYSLGKNMNSTIPLVELGGLLRFMMYLDGLSWLDPRATQLKQFVLGKGAGHKDQIMMMVLKRWGHESLSNDTADAYVLACMGLGHSNRLHGMTQDQRKIVGGLALKSN